MPTVPIQLRILTALQTILDAGMDAQLAATGLTASPAFRCQPVPAGGQITGDAITLGYVRNKRGTDNTEGLRLTQQQRDNIIYVVVEIWAFGRSDQDAQARAIAAEFAVTQILDAEANRYLGGVLSQPVVIGDTQTIADQEDDQTSMLWHLAIPLACRARTTRPEQTI